MASLLEQQDRFFKTGEKIDWVAVYRRTTPKDLSWDKRLSQAMAGRVSFNIGLPPPKYVEENLLFPKGTLHGLLILDDFQSSLEKGDAVYPDIYSGIKIIIILSKSNNFKVYFQCIRISITLASCLQCM